MMKRLFYFSCMCMMLIISLLSCKKESFITSADARLNITRDSVKFDTVFTSTGSITQSFKIINENNQQLRLSSVKLMGGINSPFKININGFPTVEENNIEIAANDSIYVFVSVTVNPNTANLPFILSDSIQVSYNGNTRFVQLEAFGQNAHFLRDSILTGNTVWNNDLPYVILGSLRVDTTASLTINPGCKIYTHANAPILVDGTLNINGSKNNEVVFTGDRLDAAYRDLPASWPGIYFRSTSENNQLRFAVIKNATQAVVVIDPAANNLPKLTLEQCIITNAYDAGLLLLNSYAEANNTLISNCSRNIYIEYGGKYSFTHCTVATYSNQYLLHTIPVLQAYNFTDASGTLQTADLEATFTNCIFWGDGGAVDDEVITGKEGNTVFNVNFNNCLYKALNDPADATLNAVIRNIEPAFDSIDVNNKYYDFRTSLNPFAPGLDAGLPVSLPTDLDDLPRSAGLAPDLGCYEKQ